MIRPTLAFLAGAALGFGVWLVSPSITGHSDAWDAAFPFYAPFMIAGGAVVGSALPRRPIVFLLGVGLGQVLALAVLPGHDRSWLAFGVVTTSIGSALALPGYLIASLARAWHDARQRASR